MKSDFHDVLPSRFTFTIYLHVLPGAGFWLCKAITKFFSTVNQPDISFRSLKNAMDAPREQALEMFMEKWVGYLDKATDIKVMN